MVGARGGKVMIRDVAATAGVSYQTASRVLNKSPNVSPAALTKVEDAVDRLGYSLAEAAATALPDLAAPPTAINQPTADMTARAAELLIGTPGKGDPGPHIIPLELIARQSSGPVRA